MATSQSTATLPPPARATSRVHFAGKAATPRVGWFAAGIERQLLRNGHELTGSGDDATLVVNLLRADRPRPFRRKSQGTFLVGIVELNEEPEDLLRTGYPLLVRSLSNLLVVIVHTAAGTRTHFVTLEQGYYTIAIPEADDEAYFREVYGRMAPLASTRLVINNVFRTDLAPELWDGDEKTGALMAAGRRLDAMNLLPAAFPIAELLSVREMNHVKRLFGIGGLSYGNLSVRQDEDSFWMSARGVNKGKLSEVGRDVLLITDFLPEQHAMQVSVPPHVEPRAASVDAIEHWCLYTRHPGIGAIIHVHAWMEGVPSTLFNYPCGTHELAEEVAALVARAPDPSRTVVGLKNHGLTITGRTLDDIFERIDGRLIRTIPME
jgi:hypothetical protein